MAAADRCDSRADQGRFAELFEAGNDHSPRRALAEKHHFRRLRNAGATAGHLQARWNTYVLLARAI
jgi:hypothetical protein